jgi:DNA invertase Pin-like site-specific DNA recombinase
MAYLLESDFISKRNSVVLAKKRAGLPLGRPKGRVNNSLKLDKHDAEIRKYLSLRFSRATIAKLVGCHPQTLRAWLELKSPNDISG